MVDDLKSLKDNLFKALAGKPGQSPANGTFEDEDDEQAPGSFMDSSAARAIISTIFAKAGKGKDDVVQTLAREIGMAVAGMLKQPLSQLAKNQKLQITFEFVPKDKESDDQTDSASNKTSTAKPKKSEKPRKSSKAKRTK